MNRELLSRGGAMRGGKIQGEERNRAGFSNDLNPLNYDEFAIRANIK